MALYIDVPALAPALQKIRDAGGSIVVERMDVPGVGAFALFQDPDGRVNGIWEQAAASAPPK
jgi:predicted enzyme related to lactoylglutathione lyase